MSARLLRDLRGILKLRLEGIGLSQVYRHCEERLIFRLEHSRVRDGMEGHLRRLVEPHPQESCKLL